VVRCLCSHSTMRKKYCSNILITLISILAFLFCAEVILRLGWQMGGWVERPIYRKSADPYLRYELVPGANSGNISVNSGGFRGPEYPIAKPPGTFRILMLGDSETLSIMLTYPETLSSQLEALLNSNSPKRHYEVLNFGVEGYNTLQELELLKKKGLKYDPDLIILNYVLNDPEPGEYYFNKSFLMRHSALTRYITYRIKKALIKRERRRLHIHSEVEHFYYLHQPKFFSHIQEAIVEMSGIARERGRKLVVVIFPTSSTAVGDFKERYPYWPLHKLVKSIPSENIIFIDLIDLFNKQGLSPQDVSINYQYNESHKNAPALSLSADYICGILKTRGLVE